MSGKVKQPTDAEIIQRWKDAEPCRHGTKWWCEDCVNETYRLHTEISKANYAKFVADTIKDHAGKAWMADKHDVANKLKELAKMFDAQTAIAKEEADKLRKLFKIGRYREEK